MAAKLIVFALFVVSAHGSASHGDYTSFSYGVADPHTGDVKNQHETRVGDSVVGQYSLIESDGHRRTVDYAANAHSGFNAVVRREPAVFAHAAPVVVAAPTVVAAPVAYAAHSAPLAYAARAVPLAVGTPGAVSYSAYSNSIANSSPLSYAAVAPVAYGAYGAYGPARYAHGPIVAPLAQNAYRTYGLSYGHGARLGW